MKRYLIVLLALLVLGGAVGFCFLSTRPQAVNQESEKQPQAEATDLILPSPVFLCTHNITRKQTKAQPHTEFLIIL